MSHQLHRLHPRHYRMLDLVLAGMRAADIAVEMGMTRRGVSNVLGSPVFQHELARRRGQVEKMTDEMLGVDTARSRRMMEEAAVQAAQVQVDCLSDPNPRIRLRSSEAILDRTLVGKGRAAQAQPATSSVVMDAKQAEGIRIALREDAEMRAEWLDDRSGE